MISDATFKIWRTRPEGDGTFQTFHSKVSEGMVVLDVVHQIQAEQAHEVAGYEVGDAGHGPNTISGEPADCA